VAAAGGASGRGATKKKVPACGSVLRASSGSPPPLRPEPKWKEPLPPKAAAVSQRNVPLPLPLKVVATGATLEVKEMRILGSSIPADVRLSVPDVDRDVTAENLFSAVSLLLGCGPGGKILGPARCAATSPSPPYFWVEEYRARGTRRKKV